MLWRDLREKIETQWELNDNSEVTFLSFDESKQMITLQCISGWKLKCESPPCSVLILTPTPIVILPKSKAFEPDNEPIKRKKALESDTEYIRDLTKGGKK